MDALVHPHKHAPSFALHIPARHFETVSSSVVEPDPVLEDTPDTPDETVDYTVYPPEVGQTVIINEIGNEVALCETPIKNGKRVICSFPYQNPQTTSDPDEYPFHAVTYGECESCFGLPYNDHNYASKDQKCKGSRLFETDDRLSILAKVALAKDQKAPNTCTDSDSEMGQQSVHPENGFSVTIVESPTVDPVPTNVNQHPTPKTSSVIYNSEIPVYPNMQSSLVTTTRVAAPANRTILLSTSRGAQNPPLQIHRVSSSLTPHVVLRTGLPGLQISTSASRTLPNDASVQCICDNNINDGYLIQCEKCRSWQHSNCVSLANKGRLPSPYVCDHCQSRSLHCAKAITVQRQKITTFNTVAPAPTSNPAIRISRATALNTGNSNRIYVTTSLCNAPARQVHVCLPTTTTTTNLSGNNQRAEVNFITTGSTAGVEEACYPNGANRTTSFTTYGQPMRSSKRKQDLLTLTSSSAANAGLEGFSSSPPGTEGFGDLSDTNTSFSVDANAHFAENSTIHVSSSAAPSHVPLVSSENRDSGVRNFTGSLHRLLLDYPNNNSSSNNNNNNNYNSTSNTLHNPPNHDGDHRRASPSSTISSNSVVSSSHVAYEEATDLKLSDRLYHKLDILFPAFHGLSTNYNDSCAYLKDLPTDLDSLQRCEVVNFDFNRKGLVATEDIYPREPIIEYRGLCMLLTEYNEVYDYRKHYNPFVLFYKAWTKLALCVDARKYGNDARFIRRSCTPNCEVKHSVSFSDDPISGPTPRIRLLVVATRSICRSSELTLPFDFDYTACRYLVRCACIRKACPVSRWFQRSSQLTGTVQTPSRTSLICSRKLPNASRGYGLNGRPRAFSPLKNVDEEQLSDDQDDEELRGWYSKTAGTNTSRISAARGAGRHGVSSSASGRLWASTHSQLHSRISMRDPSSLATGATGKPGRRRGRGRGRVRSSVMLDRRNSNRSLVKLSNRGRPAGSGKTMTSKKHGTLTQSLRSRNLAKALVSQGSPLYSPKKRDDNDGGRREPRLSKDSTDLQSNNLGSPHSKSEMDFSGSIADRADSSTLGHLSPDDHRHETHAYSGDELDADTEPECDGMMSDMLEHRLTPKKSSHSKSRTKSDEFHDSLDTGCGWDQPSDSDGNRDDGSSVRFANLDTESRRHSTSNYTSSKSLHQSERGKRRHNSVAGDVHSSSSQYKKSKSREEKQEKSREEVWMAEVLRRIERMEKKRLKQRSSAEQNMEVKVENSPDEDKQQNFHSPTPNLTPTDVLLDGSTEDPNEQDFTVGKTLELENTVVISLTPTSEMPKMEALPPSENMDVKYVPDIKSSILSHDSYLEPRRSSESTLRSPSLDHQTVENEIENIKPPLSPLNPITKSKSSRSSRNSRSRHSPPRQRRRRSQAALLSDGLSTNSAEQGGSREDRWLQQQLRRIAELEDQDDATSPWEVSNSQIKRDSPDSKDKSSLKRDDLMLDSNEDTADSDQKYALPTCSKSRRRRISSGVQMQSSDERSNHKDALDEQKPNAEMDASNGQNPKQKTTSDVLDLDTDCGLIVYRAREKDPMAKFSRSRSATEAYSSCNSLDAYGSANPMHELDIVNKPENPMSGTMARLSSHLTPKPTKKRWLSQALLEEDGDSCAFTNGNHTLSNVNEAVSDKKPDLESASMAATLSHGGGPSICAVNPKKRIISKFSELKQENMPGFVCDRESTLNLTSSTNMVIQKDASSAIVDESAKETTTNAAGGVKDCSEVMPHATPLPPKKATVKQQAEELRLQEMRKVRVSLSEYRRRRGLPANPAPLSAPSSTTTDSVNKEPVGKPNPSNAPLDIDDLEINIPPVLMSPSKLLNVMPAIPDTLQSLRSANLTTSLTTTITEPNTKPSGLQDLYRPYPSDPRLANHQKPEEFVEIHANERGPRTPSEPPDDEDDAMEDLNSPNHISKAALSSSPEPSVNFGYKAYSRSVTSPKYSSPQTDTRNSVYEDDLVHRNASASKPQISAQSNRNRNSIQEPLNLGPMDHLESSGLKYNSSVTQETDCPPSGDMSTSPSLHSHTSSKVQSNLPPPPPPPFVNFSSHPKTDINSVQHQQQQQSPIGSHRLESESGPNEKASNCVPGSLEYFIKRDQEIRMWQETRSYERERRHSSPWLPRPPHPTRVRHSRKPSFNTSSRHSSKELQDTENFFPNQVSVAAAAAATGHFDNVEQTLWRICDTLQAQLDVTKMASATHGTSSSTNGNGTMR